VLDGQFACIVQQRGPQQDQQNDTRDGEDDSEGEDRSCRGLFPHTPRRPSPPSPRGGMFFSVFITDQAIPHPAYRL